MSQSGYIFHAQVSQSKAIYFMLKLVKARLYISCSSESKLGYIFHAQVSQSGYIFHAQVSQSGYIFHAQVSQS